MAERAEWIAACNKARIRIEKRSPEILQYADDLYSRIQTTSGQVRYLNGLFIMATITNDAFFKHMNRATVIAAVNRGVDVSLLGSSGFNTEDNINDGSITIAKAAERADIERDEGKITGLLHGHYRMLTPGSMLGIVLAGEQCDSLYLGLERNWRTSLVKGAEPVYKNRMRENIMISLPRLADHVVAINRLAYTDEGYRRMVKTISPDVYFGNESNSQEMRDEMSTRAKLAGAEYRELEHIPSFSTSKYLELGGKTEPDFTLLLGVPERT